MRVEFTPEAGEDIEEAFFWYDERGEGLGQELLDALAQTIERVKKSPLMYRVIAEDVRVALVKRFPYTVYYRVVDDLIIVISCFHQRRSPELWRDRL